MSDPINDYLKPYASLRLTVALMAAATFLVFAGTVAQVDEGIWTVVDKYFRCAFTRIELRIFFPRSWDVPGAFWFPGGWFIGGLLLMNLLAAHVARFKMKARGGRLAAGLLVLAGGAALLWLVISGAFQQDVAATHGAAFWRVLFRLANGAGVALVLMLGCALVFGRRGGIVLLHGGIILLFISEFVTGTFAVEGRMRIEAGQSVNYVERMRSVELAFIDTSDAGHDHVTVVPMAALGRGGIIQDPLLPVDVEVVRFMRNCRLVDAGEAAPTHANPATEGAGLLALAIEQPEASGTDPEQTLDVPAIYVTLRSRDDGRALGTWLASPWLKGTSVERQVVRTGGKEHELHLRFARTYKPWSIELVEFRHDTYVGTDKPKNFSSVVRLVDESRGVDRTVKIWMNNPLRYGGETFYQSSFEPGKDLTILQVVRNDGWMIPYLSCMIVSVGLTAHMGTNLLGFLRRRAAA